VSAARQDDIDVGALLRRAEAAERTVEVLKRKVFDLYNGDPSALQRQLEKARLRDENNRRKREIVELRAAELKRYSETLEAEVRRRTEAIKTILDNVTFGFLVVDRDLVVQPECTRSCAKLFATTKVEGEKLVDLLGLPERARLSLVLGVDQLFEDVLPFEASVAQIGHKFQTRDGRMLQIDFSAIRGPAGEVSRLLLTVSDISALEAATRESNTNRTLVAILKQKESFRYFLVEARRQLEAVRAAVGSRDQGFARQAIHTLKGNSASYGLEDIVAIIHEVEEAPSLQAAHVEAIGEALRDFVRVHEHVLDIDYDQVGEEGFAVTRDQMSKLRGLISALPREHGGELKRWTARVLRKPAWQVLGPLADFTEKLGVRLGKDVAFRMDGGDTTVDVEAVRPVFQVITHLLRNAVDHGVESAVERRGKPARGKVEIAIAERSDGYLVRCADDGRGVDVDALARRAVQLGFVSPERLQTMTSDERLGLVFVDGLSSAPVTTSISGRGVGMSAVKSAVERVGGQIDIASRCGEGTTINIVIPKPKDVGAPEIAHAAEAQA
jgi:two-component system chemotaxis sensor kinase CheA